MTSSDIFDAVAKQVDVPREMINEICLSWSRDVFSLYRKRTARVISLYDLGNLYFKSYKSSVLLEYMVADFEQTFEQYKPDLTIANERVRSIITKKVDILLANFSQILQNVYYSKKVKKGFNVRIRYDFDHLDKCIERFYRVLNAMPCQLKREEPSEIQKKALRSLLCSKAYIDLPDYLDCPMWPVRMHYKPKNSLYGMSLSAIILERNKMIEYKRQKGIETIPLHNKNKKAC